MSCRIDATVAASGPRVCAADTATRHASTAPLIPADLAGRLTLPLDQRHDAPRRYIPPHFLGSVRPSYFHAFDARRRAQPGMDAEVVLRVVATAPSNFAHECGPARDDPHARTD